MFAFISIVISIIALITAFFSTFLSWIIIVAPSVGLMLMLWSAKQRKWKEIPEISREANAMLKKFGHFYVMPYAAKDFSQSASIFQLVSVVIGFIGVFKGFYWGLGIAAFIYISMALMARAFNPTHFLLDENEKIAHKEIIQYLHQKDRQLSTKTTVS